MAIPFETMRRTEWQPKIKICWNMGWDGEGFLEKNKLQGGGAEKIELGIWGLSATRLKLNSDLGSSMCFLRDFSI